MFALGAFHLLATRDVPLDYGLNRRRLHFEIWCGFSKYRYRPRYLVSRSALACPFVPDLRPGVN
jgi:hypothetical protein